MMAKKQKNEAAELAGVYAAAVAGPVCKMNLRKHPLAAPTTE